MQVLKTLTVGAAALSVLATAGIASAAPAPQRGHYEHNDRNDHRGNDFREWDRHADRHFKAGRYQPPRGYKARHFGRGERLPLAYRSRAYVVDYNRYGLRAPPRGYQYVRVNNDVVLTAVATGLIAAVVADLFN